MAGQLAGRIFLAAAFALSVALGAPGAARADSDWRSIAASEEWMHDFTVLTMSHDGAWGVATDPFVNRAIARAIANCKAMSGQELGCGAYSTSIRAGWTLGIRCGSENILVAEKTLLDAEHSAQRREADLRANYAPNMPECVRLVTVDSNGEIVAPAPAGYSGRLPATR